MKLSIQQTEARRIPFPQKRASRLDGDARARVTGSDTRRCASGKWHASCLYKWRVSLEVNLKITIFYALHESNRLYRLLFCMGIQK